MNLIIERNVRINEEIRTIGLVACLLEFAENQVELEMCTVDSTQSNGSIEGWKFVL